MHMTMALDKPCSKCGENDLVWWYKDETESHMEVYMDCRNCGYEYPKRVVSKEDNTSESALKEEVTSQL